MIAYTLDIAGSTARTHDLGDEQARGQIVRSIDVMQKGIEHCLDLNRGYFEGQLVRVRQSHRLQRRGLTEGDGVLFLMKSEDQAVNLCRCILRALAEVPTELPVKVTLDTGDAVWPPGKEWADDAMPQGMLLVMVVGRLQSVAEPQTLVIGRSMYGRIEKHDAALRRRFTRRVAEFKGIPGETEYWIAGAAHDTGAPMEKAPDEPAYQKLEGEGRGFSRSTWAFLITALGIALLSASVALYVSR